MAAVQRKVRPESDLFLERPVLTPQRVFVVALGGRRRVGDIVDHLERHISNQKGSFRPMVAILDLVHGEAHDAAREALIVGLVAFVVDKLRVCFCLRHVRLGR